MNRGVIKISDVLIRNDWDDISGFMKDFRPTHIEFRHWENDIWYFYGVSKKFDPLKEGDAVPEYLMSFMWDENDIRTHEFKRV